MTSSIICSDLFGTSLVTSKSVRRRRSLGGRGKDILGRPTHGGCAPCWDWWGWWGDAMIWFQIWKSLRHPQNELDSRNVVTPSKASSTWWLGACFCGVSAAISTAGAGTWQQDGKYTMEIHASTFSHCEPHETWQECHSSSPNDSFLLQMNLRCNTWWTMPPSWTAEAICSQALQRNREFLWIFNPFPTKKWPSFFGQTDPDSFADLPPFLVAASFIQLPMESRNRVHICCGNRANNWSRKNFWVRPSSHPVLLPQQKIWRFSFFFLQMRNQDFCTILKF